jgi:NAD(P)H-nitrite reductase large subunit
MQLVDYLIVGGGVAGTTAAETIRKLDANATITIVSDEPHPLYSRVLLPHYIRGKVGRDFVFLKKPTWYEEQSIELKNGTTLAKINPTNHTATTHDDTEYQYKKLLLATGGQVRKLDFPELRGTTYFRTIEDADTILELLDAIATRPKSEQVGVVCGGGFIGLEFAPIFCERGIETHVSIRESRYWEPVFDVASSEFLHTIFKEQDIHLHTNTRYVKVEGSDALLSVDISGTRVPASLLGIGIGLIPNFTVPGEAGVTVRDGIVTNEYLETNVPNVYAAGDIAEFHDVTVGRQRVVGNWMNAQQQGACAGKNMVGERTEFRLVSSYATTPFGTAIVFLGDTDRLPGTEVISRGSVKDRSVGQIFVRKSKIVGATLMNMARERRPLTQLIERGTDIQNLKVALGDISTDLGFLVG